MSTSRVPWLAVAIACLLTSSVSGQDRSEKVRITTVDGVDLAANWYPCRDPKTKNPAVVLMLHPIGENSQKKPWVNLAETLQQRFAVLTFDFRGHGNSTDVEPETFWLAGKQRINMAAVAGGKVNGSNYQSKTTIDIKEFNKSYYPVLVNDIAAAKAFLDRKNDTGACNTSSFILLGADTGATLGAIWMNAEMHRYRIIQDPVTLLSRPAPRAEGQDYIGCVWLSITSNLGGATVPLSSVLGIPLRQNATPMIFLHSNEDSKGKQTAASLMSFKTAKEKAKYPLTDRIEIKAGKLTGMDLVQKSLKTDTEILAYLTEVVDVKGREWTEREFKKTVYAWRIPINSLNLIPCHASGENNLIFDTYTRFARSLG